MEEVSHSMAVRFYAGELSITKAITQEGKEYQLLNLPYYLGAQVERYLGWFEGGLL